MLDRALRSAGLVACALSLTAVPALAQDSDQDGAPDAQDAFPCDATLQAVAYAPAQGTHGVLLFEDGWPQGVDYDFNDLVLAYSYTFGLTADGRVVELRATLDPLAVGGDFTNGLGLHLPVAFDAASRIQLTRSSGVVVDLVPTAADAELTVVLLDSLRAAFADAQGPINSITGQPPRTGETLELSIRFATPVALPLGEAPFDLFIFRAHTFGHQVHAPAYPGTAAMKAGLFGTFDDASSSGRWFVDVSGLPYVLHVPVELAWPAEQQDIALLYPDITGFAASGGLANADFYTSTVQPAFAYSEPGTPTPGWISGPTLPVDTSCVPSGSCKEILAAGASTGNGDYLIDPDGPGGAPGYTVYCDMSTSGGGWTRLTPALVQASLTHQFIDYRNNCSVATWLNGYLHFGETGSCNSGTEVALAITLPFTYSQFFLDAFVVKDGASSGSWDMGVSQFNSTSWAWGNLSSASWGDIAFGSRDLPNPTTSFGDAGIANNSSCTGCNRTFPADRQIFSLGLGSNDFTIRARENGGQVEDVYVWTSGAIYVR